MKLSKNMIDALKNTEPGDMMAGGPTRAALIRRDLLTKLDVSQGRGGILTELGESVRAKLLDASKED